MQVPYIAAFLVCVVSLIGSSAAAADVLKPIREDRDLVHMLARVANSHPLPTVQPFRSVVFSLLYLRQWPDPRLGDATLVEQDLRHFVEALAEARFSELQAGDIRVLNQEDVETSGLQPCEVLYARISFHFKRHDAEWATPGDMLGAILIEYQRRPIVSLGGDEVVCAGPVTPYAFPVFTDLAGPALFVLRANQQLENVSELRRSLQLVLDSSLSANVVRTSTEARRLVRLWNEGE
jgi:hypothetical protein